VRSKADERNGVNVESEDDVDAETAYLSGQVLLPLSSEGITIPNFRVLRGRAIGQIQSRSSPFAELHIDVGASKA
jgi:hypothetical protein